MLGKLLNKIRPRNPAPAPATASAAARGKGTLQTPAAIVVPGAAEQANRAEWQPRLEAAQGNDDALLALAREAPLHDIRHAAIRALHGEDALKQAEREFRGHDKRLHRAAKETLDTLVRARATRTQAAALIDAARALTTEALLPANRLVELDQAWRALDATLLDAVQKTDFAAVQQQLAALARERGERQRQILRWTEQARAALAGLRTAADSADVANIANDAAALDAARQAVDAALAAPQPEPADPGCQALAAELRDALQRAEQVTAERAQRAAEHAARETAAATRQAEHTERKRERDAQHRQTAQAAEQKRAAFDAALAAAEQALAAGQLHDAGKQLAELRELAHDRKFVPDARQSERLHLLQAEQAHLKGWQEWGGEQAREELARAAEALATAAAGDKLNLQQHAHDIEQLRARWKALGRDHLGNAASQALWKRFDAALHAAWQPVAAQQQKLKETREENLQARQALLAALEAAPLPGEPATTDLSGQHAGEQALAPHRGSLRSRLPGQPSDDGGRTVARILEEFQAAWRKLGPLEHTVPRAAQRALQTRHAAAVARLETPLREARRRAHAERKQLIDRARALQTHADGRDIVAKVRALQAEWQQHAKAQPLGHKEEHALWGEFKAATDAIFAARGAAHQARDAELAAHQTTRETLIARLEELCGAALPPQELKRQGAEINAQWRAAGPAPKATAARLEAAFRRAHEALSQHAAAGRQRLWQQACDALLERLALCETREAGEDAAGLAQRWDALPPLPALLPAAWGDALQRRFATAVASNVADAGALDTALLQLEAALDMPSPPAFQEARRELKLLAMKRALEARQSAPAQDANALLAAALALPRVNPAQGERLREILARIGAQRDTDRHH